MRSVIFDLDGTLADTSGDLIAAANAALAEGRHDVRLDTDLHRSVAMKGGRAMLTAALGEGHADVDGLYPVLLDAYGAALDHHTVLFPGAAEAVEALRSIGHPVGVCTNKPEAMARALLRSLGVLDLFGSLIGADTLPVRKPDPEPLRETVRLAGGDPARAVLIGDTVTDRDTARAAGVEIILVTFGPDGQGVRDLEPDALLHDYNDLPSLVRDLG
ncbi:MAG: haloacid dehalogenase [Proteobacteria bacterium]|nr:MAG: haloacid dehalogenase [Pseudomonadota bacterium]